MPELPEVETRVRQLRPGCVGRQITGVWNDWPRHVRGMSVDEFRDRLVGQTIESLGRRGKFLLFGLSFDTLILHLRMSGDLSVEPHDAPPTRFTHTVLQFDNATELRFADSRKFGTIDLTADPATVLGKLGPEPLGEGLTAAAFHTMLHSHRRQIKPLLLDQGFLAGVGNIYANDGLWLARLHPQRTSDSLSAAESAALLSSLRTVLNEGIAHNGASLDWVYRGGNQQHNFRVHERADQPCPRCGTPIERLIVGQRGTFICPTCQPTPQTA